MYTKENLLDRYIREMTRYMTYEDAKSAKEDFYSLVEDKLGKNYDLAELENLLLKFGSPHNFSTKYGSSSNIFISGKNYRILKALLQTLFLILILSTVIYIFIWEKVDYSLLLKSIKDIVITMLISSVLSLWIAENVKNIKILNKLLKPFEIKDLYKSREKFVFKKSKLINLIFYSTVIFLSIHIMAGSGSILRKKTLQVIFFLFILRDSNRTSEGEYGKYVTMLSIFCNVLISVVLVYFLKFDFEIKIFKYFYYFIIFTTLVDLYSVILKLRRFYG
ncbi:putative membrane protein [Peptoniphilus sp. ING2-D1G]|nr:putative membrane protein [Peptoniphilus sp. ING2-D1G]